MGGESPEQLGRTGLTPTFTRLARSPAGVKGLCTYRQTGSSGELLRVMRNDGPAAAAGRDPVRPGVASKPDNKAWGSAVRVIQRSVFETRRTVQPGSAI